MMQANAILERVSTIAHDLKLANLAPQIAACRNLLHASNAMDVAVLGRFKAGKSSFLNHLTGRDVLPIGVVPLTAVITRLRAGPCDRAKVVYCDGTDKFIALEDINLYVDEKENPDNAKQVASVEVDLPELNALAPLQFVDTPGLGSALRHNTEAALQWLPNVGVALVAVSADAALSERDLALLEELRRHTPKIVLLLTKADLLSEAQRVEVLAFVRTQLRRKWNVEMPVLFYSVKPGMACLKTELTGHVLAPLVRQRGEAGQQILQHKLGSLTEQALGYLRVALAAATQADNARQALRAKLEEERCRFDVFREELHLLAHDASGQALQWTLDQLRPAQRTLQAEVTTALEIQFRHGRLRLPPFIKAYGKWLEVYLVRELTVLSSKHRTVFCEPLRRAQEHLTRSLQAFRDRLAGHVQTALGCPLTPYEFHLETSEPEAPPVDISLLFIFPLETVGWVIPMTLFRPLVERNLLRRARYEVEKNLCRLAADWQERTSIGIQELRSRAERYALNELATLHEVLGRTQSEEPRLRETILALEGFRQHVRPAEACGERGEVDRIGGKHRHPQNTPRK